MRCSRGFCATLFGIAIFLILQAYVFIGNSRAVDSPDNTTALDTMQTEVPDTLLSTGAATFKVPIEVPKGRRGIFPQLAFTYNSFKRNGWLGVGWSLDIGSIQRSTKHGLNYPGTDFVVVSGTSSIELVPVGESHPNHYSAKIEGTFLDYYFDSDISGTKGWRVTDKAGTIYFYGSTSDSRQQTDDAHIFKWHLDKVMDVDGNFMRATYLSVSGELYLNQIDYTGNGTVAPTTHVIFNSTPGRVDYTRTYASRNSIANPILTNTLLLNSVEVKFKEQLIRRYDLEYIDSERTERKLLKRIKQIGDLGQEYPNPMVFTYQPDLVADPDAGKLGVDVSLVERTSGEELFCYYLTANVTGRGKPDFIYDDGVRNPTSYIHVIPAKSGEIGFQTNDGPGAFKKGRNHDYYFEQKGFMVGDIDGNGLADIIYMDANRNIWAFFGTKTNSGKASMTYEKKMATLAKGLKTHTTYKVADINGDGYSDFIYASNTDQSGHHGEFRVLYASPDKSRTFLDEQVIGYSDSLYNPNQCKDFSLGDFNGDGQLDIVYVDSNNGVHVLFSPNYQDVLTNGVLGDLSFPKRLQVADVNGDGLADIVYNSTGGSSTSFYALLSNGAGSFEKVSWGHRAAAIGYFSDKARFFLTDVNGDGLTDILYDSDYGDNGSARWINSGGGGGVMQTDKGLGLKNPNNQASGLSVADFTGDGLPDIMYESCNENGNDCGDMRGRAVSGTFPDLLSTISNGIGGTYKITYTKSSKFKNIRLPYTVQVVSSIVTNDGSGDSTVTYDYADGLHDFVEREFRGFGTVTKTLPATANTEASTIESSFYQDSVKKGLMYRQIVKDSSGNVYKEQANKFLSDEDGKPKCPAANFPCLYETNTYIYDGDTAARQIRTSFEYDQYGNVKSRYQEGDLAVPDDQRYDETEYIYDTTKRLLSRPSVVHVRSGKDLSADEDLSRTTYAYDDSDHPNRVTSKTFLAKFNGHRETDPEISYLYDAYGNLSQQIDPNTVGATVIEYDEDTNTYPKKVTDPAGHVTVTQYNTKFSKPDYVTDSNEKTTSYYYDHFGRLETVVGPNDTIDYWTKKYTYNNFRFRHGWP